MKPILAIYLLTVLTLACKRQDLAKHPVDGVWLLAESKTDLNEFWTEPNQVPIGFRFYSKDSVEVYRNNYYVRRFRFTPYAVSGDSISIFLSDTLGWWKRRFNVRGDCLVIFQQRDTLIYNKLFGSKLTPRSYADKIILTEGSSWGSFVSAVIYPNNKTLIYVRNSQPRISDQFYIRQTPGLFKQYVESSYWVNQIMRHKQYDLFCEKYDAGTYFDGAFSEALLLGKDSSQMAERGQMRTYHYHLLGLQGYAFSKILKYNSEWKAERSSFIPLPLVCDSVRSILFPICKLSGVSGHLSISTLIEEGMTSPHRRDYPQAELNFHFSVDCRSDGDHFIQTNGRIVTIGHSGNDYYDLGYNFIDILTKH